MGNEMMPITWRKLRRPVPRCSAGMDRPIYLLWEEMSRSKHTIPPRIRAPRRVRAPDEPRGYGDASTCQAFARALKELGIRLDWPLASQASQEAAPLPRLRVARPQEGFHHPAGRPAVVRLLRFFGEPCTYGLRSIELVRSDAGAPAGEGLPFGRLVVPGRILLYEQPVPPWVLPGRLPEDEGARLRLAGALIEPAGLQTMVAWPGETLREFMLFDVLMHEIGHHMIQQYKGKRPARVVRTREHEAFAARFARRCHQLYLDRPPSGP